MRSLSTCCLVLCATVFLPQATAVCAESSALPDTTPWNLAELKQPPTFRWIDNTSPIRSLAYKNEPYQGHDTEVFAFYATPGTISRDTSNDKNLPTVVLIHGGGGTAFAEWVWLWARRGYAAIAMDLSGHRPPAPEFDPASGELVRDPKLGRTSRTRLELAGPDQGHEEKFASIAGDTSEQWPYHAVAAVIRAHSLVRSFPEVDARRTAVTGISWGGYTTCLVAALDDRFSAAVPVYGCGFLHQGESVQKAVIDRLEPDLRDRWVQLYDPSSYMKACRTPILFVNGTNDKHYPLDSYAKTYSLVSGPRQLRIQVAMSHSHVAGWAPEEIGLFVDHHLRGGTPLASIDRPKLESGRITAAYRCDSPITEASLHFTVDTGPLVSRRWQSAPATVSPDTISAAPPPPGTTIRLFTLTDDRGATVSSEVVFGDGP